MLLLESQGSVVVNSTPLVADPVISPLSLTQTGFASITTRKNTEVGQNTFLLLKRVKGRKQSKLKHSREQARIGGGRVSPADDCSLVIQDLKRIPLRD